MIVPPARGTAGAERDRTIGHGGGRGDDAPATTSRKASSADDDGLGAQGDLARETWTVGIHGYLREEPVRAHERAPRAGAAMQSGLDWLGLANLADFDATARSQACVKF